MGVMLGMGFILPNRSVPAMDVQVQCWYESIMPAHVWYAARSCEDRTWTWNHTPPGLPCLNLFLVASGHGGRLRHAGHTWELVPGDCLVIPMWEQYNGWIDGDGSMTVLWAQFALSKVEEHHAWPRFPLYRRVNNLPMMTQLGLRMADVHQGPVADIWLAAMLAEMDHSQGCPDRKMQDAADVMRNQPGPMPSVTSLAHRFGVTPATFTRHFRRAHGCDPRTFAMRVRIHAAQAALLASDAPVSVIATQLGFHDLQHFSRRFRQHVGVSPTSYRQHPATTL